MPRIERRPRETVHRSDAPMHARASTVSRWPRSSGCSTGPGPARHPSRDAAWTRRLSLLIRDQGPLTALALVRSEARVRGMSRLEHRRSAPAA